MALKERYLQDAVAEDLAESMVFIGGPRQVGKTTLARDIIGSRFKINYYNWDKIEHRVKALRGKAVSACPLIFPSPVPFLSRLFPS